MLHQLITQFRFRGLMRKLHDVLYAHGFEGAYIERLEAVTPTHWQLTLSLPPHKASHDLSVCLPSIKEECQAHDILMKHETGKRVIIDIGKNALHSTEWDGFLQPDTLTVTFPSAFGEHTINFHDGASCHMLNGGTTRMGKTVFLLYICTVLYLQNPNTLHLFIVSAKIKDFYPFKGLPNVTLSQTHDDMRETLHHLKEEYHKRNRMLQSKTLEKAKDAKDVERLYPLYKHHFEPCFFIIDEYARFSDQKDIVKDVIELVETAGFVNIHVIIATQRPDGRTVLNPRIKANLLLRICFTTADEKNSELILDQKGAERLGRIAGRAILLDSFPTIIQVPFLSTEKAYDLLTPFRKDGHDDHNQNETTQQKTTGSTNSFPSDSIQGDDTRTFEYTDLLQQFEPHECVQSSDETAGSGWGLLSDSENKR